METNQGSINIWTDKENVLYTHNGILFSLISEGNPDNCVKSKPGGHYAKWKKPVKGQILNDSTYICTIK